MRAFVVFHALALFASTVFSPAFTIPFAAATPFPLPMSMMASELTRSSSVGDFFAARSKIFKPSNASHPLASRVFSPFSPSYEPRGLAPGLLSYTQNLQDSFQSFKQCRESQDQDNCMSDLKSLQLYLRGFYESLTGEELDRGLANYDPNNPCQIALRDIIDFIKCFLLDLDIRVFDLPLVGPLLGPILYDIKCIIDDVLDLTENLTDATLNSLAMECQGYMDEKTRSFCGTDRLHLLGLCAA
ncbi:hypothetical protein D9758_000266 [Tetrapyrgos nigripes]|uniref:Uncharacterized protein n=1 Tax=Tetrapyrgos nigripes TaxID=182062 RepID=A0A8H5H251_9AGAR|nr:hypothetical protein D9758_000266 [Tetrapyrgos nigripes]